MSDKDSKDSRFNDKREGLRASNTTETLKPRDIAWPTATLPSPGYAGAPADVPPELPPQGRGLPPESFELDPVDIIREADKPAEPAYNILPVDWPASFPAIPKKFYSPITTGDRLARLEEQLDALLDRIALHNVRSSHKI